MMLSAFRHIFITHLGNELDIYAQRGQSFSYKEERKRELTQPIHNFMVMSELGASYGK
jgi:hypothetical protein